MPELVLILLKMYILEHNTDLINTKFSFLTLDDGQKYRWL